MKIRLVVDPKWSIRFYKSNDYEWGKWDLFIENHAKLYGLMPEVWCSFNKLIEGVSREVVTDEHNFNDVLYKEPPHANQD